MKIITSIHMTKAARCKVRLKPNRGIWVWRWLSIPSDEIYRLNQDTLVMHPEMEKRVIEAINESWGQFERSAFTFGYLS